ncbi:hypothetical protein AB6831_04065 [Carnobacterium divergens]|uniref:hypothetical protein n=1 Tax=Carnobacterium divergens TaxID=2748 RepID=UPI0039C93D65
MNDSIKIDIENLESVNYPFISETLSETLTSFSEMVNEMLKPLIENVKNVLKAIQKIVQGVFKSINLIDFSKTANQFYFTNFATLDVSDVKARRNQLLEKIIEESNAELPLSYSVIYKFDDILSKPVRNSNDPDCSENDVSNFNKNIMHKISSSINLEFMVQTAFVAFLSVLIPGELSLFAITSFLTIVLALFGKKSD